MGLVKAKLPGRSGSSASRLSTPESDAAARRADMRQLASVPGSETALLARLRAEADRQIRETIVLSLIALGTEEAVLGLAIHLGGEDVELRNSVVEALESMPDALAPHLGRLLSHPDSDVRIFVCNVLAGLHDSHATAWLCTVLERELHPNVCAAAVDALMEAGTPDCLHALNQVITRFPDEPFLCFAAKTAITRVTER
jgi:HEAT repeat protein